ncbi:MAG: CehA/McbA family metallohydrolase [Candidatus Heimdallarchaeaceae archaeon]
MEFYKNFKRIAFHLAIYLVIVGLIMATSVLLRVFGPPKFIYNDSSWDDSVPFVPQTNVVYDVLLDQHSHTKNSDGKLTTRQNIEWHIAQGFTAVVITDHNTLENAEEIQQLAQEYLNSCIIIQGMEWTTTRIHFNFIGIKEWNLDIPRNPTDDEIRQAIDEVHRQNGTVTFNHPDFTRRTTDEYVPSNQVLMNWGVDFFEVINGLDLAQDAYAFAQANNDSVGMITGTDMHSPQRDDGGRVYAWTALNVTSFTEEDIMEELREHRTEIVINQFGIENHGEYELNKAYDFFSPFYQLGDVLIYFHLSTDRNFDYADRIILYVFLSYSALIFVFVESILLFRRSLKNR